MKYLALKPAILCVAVAVSMVALFQNCAPAKLNAVNTESSMDSSSVGSKVDLSSMLKSPVENPANVLFPINSGMNEFDYALNTPVIENIVLLKNDFNKIEWVHAATSTVVASGESFFQEQFSESIEGLYYIFGYRGSNVYLLSQFRLVKKGSTSLGVNSVGAVQVTKKSITSDSVNEWILIQAEAPMVDLISVRFQMMNTGISIGHKRAILVAKRLNESFNVNVMLIDMMGQMVVKTVALPATAPSPTPTPVPTPTPTPVPTPTPTPVPTPTPTPVPTPTSTPVPTPTPTPVPTPTPTPVPTPTPTPVPTPTPTPVPTPTPTPTPVPTPTPTPVPTPTPTPKLSVSTTNLIFATSQVVSTTSGSKSFTLTNSGTAPLIFSTAMTVLGDFKLVSTTCTVGTSYAPGSGCSANISFTPTAAGTRTGSVTIKTNAIPNTTTVALTGTGVAAIAEATVSIYTMNFGSVSVGTTSAAQVITLTNTGNVNLVTSSPWTISPDYSYTTPGTCATSLAPGGTCSISVVFKPTSAGMKNGLLYIYNNATNSPRVISLFGEGIQPAATAAPLSLTFPRQALNTRSAVQFVTITNTGSAPLMLTSHTVSGNFSFGNVGSCVTSVYYAPGTSCTISIAFTPTFVGIRSGTLNVYSNASTTPKSIPLTGEGY